MANDGVNIAIPTYNRAKSLRKTLFLLCNALSSTYNVNVFVIDNASTDNTKDVLIEAKGIFEANSLRLNYKINKENIGYDGSLLYIAENLISDKRFTWFLCDDDHLICDGVTLFVKHLVQETEKKMVVATFFNPLYNSAQDENIYFRASFLSSLALKGNFNRTDDMSYVLGSSYIHLAIINSIIKCRSEIEKFDTVVGIQMPNISHRFNYLETFLIGYPRGVMFRNDIIPKQELLKKTISRVQNSSALALLDYGSNCNYINWKPNIRHIVDIYKLFGVRAYKIFIIILLTKFPRKIIRIAFNKKINAYLQNISDKQKLIKKYE